MEGRQQMDQALHDDQPREGQVSFADKGANNPFRSPITSQDLKGEQRLTGAFKIQSVPGSTRQSQEGDQMIIANSNE